MKKRILALALAGTTAFSVFGAALSANAWDQNNTTDTLYDVDAYQSYNPVATTITASYTGARNVREYLDKNLATSTWKPYTTEANITDYIKTQEVKDVYTPSVVAGLWNVLVDVETGKIVTPNADKTGVTYSEPTEEAVANAMTTFEITKTTGEGSNAKYTVNYNNNNVAVDSLAAALVKGIELYTANGQPLYIGHFDMKAAAITDVADYIADDDYNSLKTINEYRANIETRTASTGGTAATGDITVTPNNNDAWNEWSDWTFNSDLTGEVAVEPYEVTTYYDNNGKLVVKKAEAPTIYAYDYLFTNDTESSASTIASAWNNPNSTKEAVASTLVPNGAVNQPLNAEVGRGKIGVGIRYDVVSDWEDFMEELALNDNWGYSESWTEFRSNYLDMFYSDPVFDRWTGELVGSVDVDLYNIEGLLWDIWQLHNEADYYAANTSQLIYLMQQYDKYIGNYIDQGEVTSDEWGDLLLSVLDAATEEDFRTASEYRKYQNEVEDLRDAYELATTVNMIREAEVGMYNLLTTRNSQFRASATPDKAALNSTMEGLYFNVKTAPAEYSVLPSTQSTNVDYTNYNYYVSTLNVGTSVIGQNLQFTGTLSRGYYSLYPMNDYYEAGNKNEVYAGNTASATVGVNANAAGNYYVNGTSTDEYEWFWNVYQLAANMNSNNTKQGSVDAVNDALNEAVAELAVTTTPNSVDTGAMADAMAKYEGKVDSDYNEGYYAKYTQAYDYAENAAEGLWQTRIASMIVGVAGEALTYQGTQVTITKNDMKTVETAIANGKSALEAIKNSADYNAAQVNALNKAINEAQTIVDIYEGTYSTSKNNQSVNKNYSRLVGDKDQIVKSDLTNAIEAIDDAINYSEIVMGWSQNDAGKWMYGTEEGYLTNGWNKIGKTWFYFNADGTAKQSEWLNDNGTWYWFNSNCGAATGWAKVDGEWYFFKGNNAMKTGWEKVDGNWYYMASSGKMVTGWCEVNGKWYYFSKESNSLGQMLYSTTVDGYKLGADGAWIK